MARTSLSLSMKPSVAYVRLWSFGNIGTKVCCTINEICFAKALVKTIDDSFAFFIASIALTFLDVPVSWSGCKDNSWSSLFAYFLRDEAMTRDWTFWIRASSSSLHALLSYLWVLSMLFLTMVNFYTVHLLTSIKVLTFVLAAPSSLSTVFLSLS